MRQHFNAEELRIEGTGQGLTGIDNTRKGHRLENFSITEGDVEQVIYKLNNEKNQRRRIMSLHLSSKIT